MTDLLIPDVTLTDNTEQRTQCVFVLDGSTSMIADGRINLLNEGLKQFEKDLKNDSLAMSRVQILLIRAGGHGEATILQDWCDAIDFVAPEVEANGTTPLGVAVDLALEKIDSQKEAYRNNGIPYLRPWLFTISDGLPNDMGWEKAAERCCQAESNNKILSFPIGIKGIEQDSLDALGKFTNKTVYQLDKLDFTEFFQWVSASVTAASKSAPGSMLQLPAPTMLVTV